MKKIKNILLCFIIFVVSFILVEKVNAVDTLQSFTTKERMPSCLSGAYTTSVGTSSDDICILEDTNSNQYYCLEINKRVSGGTLHTYSSTITNGQACGIIDALEAGIISYPSTNGKSYVGALSLDKFVQFQKKLWDKENTSGNCSKVTTNHNFPVGTISISNPQNNMIIEKIDSKYFYTSVINLNYANLGESQYSIDLSSSDIIVSETKSGEGVTKSNKKTLYIRVPVSSSKRKFDIAINSYYKASEDTVITPFIDIYYHNSSRQQLGKPGLNKSITPKITHLKARAYFDVTTTSLTVQKIDGQTKQPISGVRFKLVDENNNMVKDIYGNTVGEQTTNETGNITINHLPYGSYYMKEVTAPDGYIIVNDSRKITISADNPSATITIENNKTLVKFKKVWYDAKKKEYKMISGAIFKIKDSNGNFVKDMEGNDITWHTEDKVYAVEGLKAGNYTLIEITPPLGYGNVKEINFTIKEDGSIDSDRLESKLAIMDKDALTIVVENDLNVTVFSKQDATTGKELAGATLQILDKDKKSILDNDGNEIYKWISTDEPYVIEGLPAGVYYLKELSQPEGYKLNEELVKFEVKSDGTVTKVVMKNAPKKIEVPDTASNSTLLIATGIFLGMLGVGLIVYHTKIKKRLK